MTHLKTSFAIAILACFLSVKTNAQMGVNIDSVRACLSTSQQTFGVKLQPNSFSNKPISCVFASNSFGVSYQNVNAQTDPCFDASEAIVRRNQSITPFIWSNDPAKMLYDNTRDLKFILSSKSNATIIERTAAVVLYFMQ
jgi:hypothetical protein